MLEIDPVTAPPDVDVAIPGSKSITNRALIAAALAEGTSRLSGVLFAEDTLAMMDCLEAMGAVIDRDPEACEVRITGFGAAPEPPAGPLWVRQSGTTARFVVPLAALIGSPVTVDGDDQIRSRPQGDLFEAMESLGVNVSSRGGRLPATIAGGRLSGGRVEVRGATSSQFASGLMLVAPALDAETVVELTGDVVSAPYLEMTAEVMRSFGADVRRADENTYVVAPQPYRPRDYHVEPDASTASYFFAAAAVTRGRVGVQGLGTSSVQGDTGFVDVLESMGARVERAVDRIEVTGTGRLSGARVDMADMSDTAPTLAAIAPLADSKVEVTGVGFIRNKESDRVAGPVAALRALGVEATETEDGFVVEPGPVGGGLVETNDDHRMAMAFTVLGLVVPGVVIDDPTCVAKTFPRFFDAVDELRAAGDARLRIVALDGPAGSGKSTVARALALRLGLDYLDTGAMYRSVTQAALESGVDPADPAAVAALSRHLEIDVAEDRVSIDGADRSEAIRTPEVDAAVSIVAANPEVRSAMRRQQRAWARRRGGGVLEGRDIGSVVFPSASLKVYVTASAEERARRRSLQSGIAAETILAEINERDRLDSSRADSPLRAGVGDDVIDTTGMSVKEVVEAIAARFGSVNRAAGGRGTT